MTLAKVTHGISIAHKNENTEKLRLTGIAFKLSDVVFILPINVKTPTMADTFLALQTN